MKMKSAMHYDLTGLTFKQIEAICLGLDEVKGLDIDLEIISTAKELIHNIEEGLKE